MTKELSIISGKGGTGKTSLVASLATLAEKAIIVDCDVDAADLHLLLDHKVLQTHTYIGSKEAVLKEDSCSQCNVCQQYCRFNAIDIHPLRINSLLCEGCGACVYHCPNKALELSDVQSGVWFSSQTDVGPFIHARLGIAEETTGKLVSLLRKAAKEQADQNGIPLIISDGSPGIGCPVIASITGSNLVLMITEPTLSGIHDMQRIMDLVNHFKIPALAIINKYDINEENSAKIEILAESQNIPVIGKIPYTTEITKAQLEGKPFITQCSPLLKHEMLSIWNHVKERIMN